MAKKSINPAGREGDFFKMKDISFELKVGQEYLKQDIPSTVFLYQIDITKTDNDDIYGETHSSEKVTLPRIELQVKLTVEDSETIFLGESGISKEVAGDLTFTIYNEELEKHKVDIRLGDYIGMIDTNDKMRYYEVIKRNKINNSNKNSLAGIKSFYREIKCKYVQSDVFNP
jgi:hypothetical protein